MNRLAEARARGWATIAALGVVVYLPLLLTHRGQVGADTKSYLTLDPGRLLERAASMWDPNVGLGTVPHQNIGYLWPMGPWFWLFERLGAPDWVAQRLWLGTILFLAGLGVRFLLRTLGQRGPHLGAAMFVYALSPYVLTLGARISALLLPFAGLPWMIALAIRATRDRGWLHPALFALLVPTIGGTNATALVLAGIGPVLWFPFAVLVLRELTARQALAVVFRIGALSLATSLWWIAGLWAQGAYGIDVLRYTETARTVAEGSTAPELLRGLGYWFFYGDDKLGPWIEPSVAYTQNPPLLAVTYLVPVLGLLAAGVVRWRYRAYFVALVVAGLALGVGAHPWDDPPLAGRGVKAFLVSDLGLAMRSLPRAVPLLALGLSVLAGVGIAALGGWVRRIPRATAAAVAVLALAALPPLWTGAMVANNLQRPEQLPRYWEEAAQEIDSRGQGRSGWDTRVLEVPGSDFASYRWGNTVDPITPGIIDRPYVARELIPYGTPPSADLVNALDRQMQEYTLDPASLAPVARFMAVGDINLRADLAYERYNLPRPRPLWALLRSATGLGPPTGFGGRAPTRPDPALPLQDVRELASPPGLVDPPKLALFPVEDPQPILRAVPADRPVVLAGDGTGLVDTAATGLVTGREVVLYSAALAGDRAALRRELSRPGTELVVTDTNRRAARRWSTVIETAGYTERAGEEPLRFDPTDNRLPLFPEAGDDAFTVAQQRGGVRAAATAYGNPITYTPDSRAANAVDDDLRTGWSVGAFSPVDGERLELTYASAPTTDRVTLLQDDKGVQNRWITKVRLRFDHGAPVDVELDLRSRGRPGQTINFGRRTFEKLSIEILATDVGRRDRYAGLAGVGFADVRLGDDDARLDEVIRLPRDLLDAAGPGSSANPLAIVLTRQRTRPTAPLRDDQEPALARAFRLPTARTFTVVGQARLDARAPEAVADQLLGVPPADEGGVDASSSRHLTGDVRSRALSAIDGDPTTHWSPGFLGQVGEWVRYRTAAPLRFDHMDLEVVNDGRHSVPTRLRIESAGRPVATVDVPAVADQARRDATTTVRVDLPTIATRDLTVIVDEVREVLTTDWISERPVTMPVGIAELGIPGLRAEVPSDRFDPRCRADLVTVDGRPLPVRVRGRIDDALRGRPLDLEACTSTGTRLGRGDHVLRSAKGRDRGIDVDRLVLTSPGAGGRGFSAETVTSASARAGPAARAGRAAAGQAAAGPRLRVLHQGRDDARVQVGARSTPTWVILGQSLNAGWKASVDGTDLGPPQLVNGYANGWLLPAGTDPVTVQVEWTPQRVVRASLLASVTAAAGCVVLAGLAWRRRRRSGAPPAAPAPGDQPAPFRPAALWSSTGAPPSIRTNLVATAAFAASGAVLIGPVAGVAVGLATLAALHWRRARALTTLGAAAGLGIAALYTIALQVRHRLPAGFEWPASFTEVHQVAYAGVLLLAADVMVDRLWTGRWWPRRPADAATGAHRP